jgi:hypothetical protein
MDVRTEHLQLEARETSERVNILPAIEMLSYCD